MKIPINWLKKYISFSLSPEKLAEDLTMTGTKLEALLNEGGEAVLDLEITSNRPDCLSLIGVAREVSAITGKNVTLPKIKSKDTVSKNSKASFSIHIEDQKGCPLYSARLIEGVTIKASSAEVKKNLELAGTRAINNAVDVTNFVLFEMGQPLHAFDYDKIKGHKIIVRRAKKNEKFLGLDDIEYTLDESILVIADAERAIAIAGVMGGKLTEVTGSTKNILLESAYFDPMLVRHAARKTKISTESSYRFERKVDTDGVLKASARATDLILESAGGTQKDILEARYLRKTKANFIILNLEDLNESVGMVISAVKAQKILNCLGLETQVSGKNLKVHVPNRRPDVTEKADLIEEILRIEGFDKVKPSIPVTRHSDDFIQDKKPNFIFEFKKYLAAIGFYEIATYSLVSGKSLEQAGVSDLSYVQKIRNPLSVEQEYFRPTLLIGMLQAVTFNLRHKNEGLKFFEIGNVYMDGIEKTHLAMGWYGPYEENWRRKEEAAFYDLKGAVENILAGFLHFGNFSWKPGDAENSLSLFISDVKIACLKSLPADVRQKSDIPKEFFYMEMDLNRLFELARKVPVTRLKAISKYPAVRRDIAFIVNKSIPVASLENAMRESAGDILKEARLFDEFSGKNIPEGKRSLAFSLSYQKDSGTFTDEEILKLQSGVGEILKDRFQAEFR